MAASIRTAAGTTGVGAANSGTTLTVGLPTAAATDDLVGVAVYHRLGNTAATGQPAGWTLLAQSAPVTTVGWQGFYVRVRQAGDPTSITWTGAESGRQVGVSFIIDGADPDSLLGVVGPASTLINAGTTNALITAPGVTTTDEAPLVIGIMSNSTTDNAPGGFTAPGGFVEVVEHATATGGSDSALHVAAWQQPAPGDTGAQTFTSVPSAASGQGWLLALNSAAVAVPLTVSAGADQVGLEPYASTSVTATPAGGTGPYTFSWSRVSGPAVSINGSGATRSVTIPATMDGGTALLRVTATDAAGATAADDVNLGVLPHNEWTRNADGTGWASYRLVAL